MIDKIVIALIADVLYAKGVINDAELNGMYDITCVSDVVTYTDKIIRGDFSVKRGEHYTSIAK